MKRKIIRVGTSAAVILPKSILKETDTKIGDEVDIFMQPAGHISHVRPEVIEWTRRFMEEDHDLLELLKNA